MTKARYPVKTCLICGKPFIARGRSVTCSPACSEIHTRKIHAWNNEKAKAARRAKKEAEALIKTRAARRSEPHPSVCTKRSCSGCTYYRPLWGGYGMICNYLLDTGHMRPCPPGAGCIVKAS